MTDEPETSAGEPSTSQEAAAGTAGRNAASVSQDELQFGYIGNPKTKLDERGRLKMPAEFKAFTEKKYGKDYNAFYITSRDGTDAEIFPMCEWQQHLAKVLALPTTLPARQKLLDRYNLYGDKADMDPQGRLLLPEELRNTGLANTEVKVAGEGLSLRVTPLKTLRERVSSNPFTAEEVDDLANRGV